MIPELSDEVKTTPIAKFKNILNETWMPVLISVSFGAVATLIVSTCEASYNWFFINKGQFLRQLLDFSTPYKIFSFLAVALISAYSATTLAMAAKINKYRQLTGLALRRHRKETKGSLEKFVKDATIVIHISDDIEPFNNMCIDFMRKLLITWDDEWHPERDLYAIDYSSPRSWYTDDMLAYLAIQSQWVSTGGSNIYRRKHFKPKRNVNRLFAWNYLDEIGKKILILHSLMGFNTWLVRPEDIKAVIEKSGYSDKSKDVLFWDSELEQKDGTKGKGIVLDDGCGSTEYRFGIESAWRYGGPKPKKPLSITNIFHGISNAEMLQYFSIFKQLATKDNLVHFSGTSAHLSLGPNLRDSKLSLQRFAELVLDV